MTTFESFPTSVSVPDRLARVRKLFTFRAPQPDGRYRYHDHRPLRPDRDLRAAPGRARSLRDGLERDPRAAECPALDGHRRVRPRRDEPDHLGLADLALCRPDRRRPRHHLRRPHRHGLGLLRRQARLLRAALHGHADGLPDAGAGAGHGRGARLEHPERHHRARGGHRAERRAGHPLQRALDQGEAVHRGGAEPRLLELPHPLRPRPSQLPGALHHPGDRRALAAPSSRRRR